MKILYITPCDPTDRASGGSVRSRALGGALRGLGEVQTLVVD